MLIVVATPKSAEEYWNSVPGKCLTKFISFHLSYKNEHNDKELEWYGMSYWTEIGDRVIPNNKKGLPEIYNNILYPVKGDFDVVDHYGKEDDICVFMHDDVEIHDLFFYEKLKKAHETYDIVGVAGATKQAYSKDRPSLWHLSCDNFIWGTGGKPGDGRGSIITPSNGQIIPTVFGPSPSDVKFIDGCFISVNIKKMKEVGLKFDDDFNFHHYDLQLCLDANKLGLKIGVWPIYLHHNSPGLRNFDQKFLESDKKFKEKNNII